MGLRDITRCARGAAAGPAWRSGARRDASGTSRDAGETLLELVVAIAVLGIGATALIGGLMTAVRGSTEVGGFSTAQAALRSYGEALSYVSDTGGLNPYVSCRAATGYPSATALGATPPSGVTVTVTSVRYWNGSAFVAAGAAGSPCPSPGSGTDLGLQRLTLTATAVSTGMPTATRTLDVVVRRPCAVAAPAAGAC